MNFILRLHRTNSNELVIINAMDVARPRRVDEEALLHYFEFLSVPEKLRIAKVFRWLRIAFLVSVTQAWSAATQLHEERPDFFEHHLQLQEQDEIADRQFVPFVGQAHRI